MNSTMLFHSAVPESTQTTYVEYNNVDFVINVGAGRSLLANSVRLCGEVLITSDGTARPVAAANAVYMDPSIGIHSVVSSCQTTFSNSGMKENINNYARWVKMQSVGTQYMDDFNNASNQVELRAVNESCSALLAQGEVTLNSGTSFTDDLDFAMKPNCILNKMMGDNLPFEKSGEIRLTFNLARNQSALYGPGQGSGATYSLKNLHLSYTSLETDGDPMSKSTTMRSVYNVKSTILSQTANVSVQVPASCDAVSCSFQRQNNENQNTFNNYACDMVQNIRRLQFEFNDSTNKYISYNENDLGGMIQRYIESFENSGHNQMKLDKFRSNNGFGIGQKFSGFVNLANQRFGIQLTSDINNTKPMNLYSYFHSIVLA